MIFVKKYFEYLYDLLQMRWRSEITVILKVKEIHDK